MPDLILGERRGHGELAHVAVEEDRDLRDVGGFHLAEARGDRVLHAG